jgi:hypothetical protein
LAEVNNKNIKTYNSTKSAYAKYPNILILSNPKVCPKPPAMVVSENSVAIVPYVNKSAIITNVIFTYKPFDIN